MKFCQDHLWNSSILEWKNPDFTSCFQKTVLIWSPCLFLIFLSPLMIMNSRGSNRNKSGTTVLFLSKLVLVFLLITVQTADLALIILNSSLSTLLVDYLKDALLIFTYIIVITVILVDKHYGKRHNTVLMLFWALNLFSWVLILRSSVLNSIQKNDPSGFFIIVANLVLVALNLIISFFCQKSNETILYPESRASLVSYLTFNWVAGLIFKGYKKDLGDENVWDIDSSNSTNKLANELELEWNIALNRTERYDKSINRESDTDDIYLSNDFEEEATRARTKPPCLGWILLKFNSSHLIISGLSRLTFDLVGIAGPLLLDALIKFIQNKSQSDKIGYFLALMMFIRINVQSFCLQHNFHGSYVAAIRTRNALMSLIYKKSLRLSNESKKKTTSGEVINLMQVNTQSFVDFAQHGHTLWSGPVEVILVFFVLWFYIGWSMFAGLAVLVVLVPFNSVLSKKYNDAESSNIAAKDSRLRVVNEVLNGIKMIKFYGWESAFEKLINKLRLKELKIVKKCNILASLISFNFNLVTYLITIASLGTFVFSNDTNVLDPSIAYVCLSLFNSIKHPLYLFGLAVSSFIQIKVSLGRITNFLMLDEKDERQIGHEKFFDADIVVENADLAWEGDDSKIILNNLSYKVSQGELVAIVGKVGCGKSSFLQSLLGEMNKFRGLINIVGSIAYAPQQAWIQNDTLRNNILFGNDLDETKYRRVLDSCALGNDIGLLVAGDLTEIGERGINLSGGQKQRVSLARAAYSDSDIYLLDDPLSAVDAHVGEHIFEKLIGPNGLLKNKTRLLATNSIWSLPKVDKIILLKDGSIAEMGTYDELIARKRDFFKFIDKYEGQGSGKEETMHQTNDEPSCLKMDEENFKPGQKLIETEKMKKGFVELSLLWDYIKSGSFLLFVSYLGCNVISNIFQALSSFWLSYWTNSNIEVNNSTNVDRGEAMIVYSLLGITQNFFWVVGEFLITAMIINSSSKLHETMLNKILRSRMQFFESTPTGRIMNRFSKDMNSIEATIPRSFKDVVFFALDGITATIVISITTPMFLTVLVPVAFIYILVQRFYVSSVSKLKRLDAVTKSPIFAHFSETLNGCSTIKAYKCQERFIKCLENKVDHNTKFLYPSYACERWIGINLEIVGNLMVLAAMIFVVMGRENLTPGQAGLSISYALTVSLSLRMAVRMMGDLESNLISVERVTEYVNLTGETDWCIEASKPSDDWPAKGAITFRNYSVKYRDQLDYVLKSIDCEIGPQEKIGIVGRTGAGKSTLSLALFRLLESDQGEIIIDNLNIKNLGLHDLRQRMTIIPQDPVIFSGTIRMNLDPFDQHSDHEIWSALEKVNLRGFVQGLEGKLMFECSEGGENLSVGQRQLLCLARALVRNSKIILLDEATAAIDHNTDELVQKTIRSEFKDCTILTIAHRLNTIMDSDKIIVFENGRLIEFDTPENLLGDPCSVFSQMVISAGIKI